MNAIAPVAKTRMTEGAVDTSGMARQKDNSPSVAWMASADCGASGRVIEIDRGQICLETGWGHGPRQEVGWRWEAVEVGDAVRKLVAEGAVPEAAYGDKAAHG